MGRIREVLHEWRPSMVTAGLPTFPLMILFGLNAVDELDRVAYAILLPEIRDHFELDNQGILTVLALSTVVILCLEIPLAHLADRRSRVKIATYGAAAWALFAFGTGLATSIAMLVLMRIGAGLGRAVVTPTHGPLLADYYPPDNRVKVFGLHRLANSVGQIAGPIIAGALAFWFDWRLPFFVLAFPTLVLVVLATRLQEPVRGGMEKRTDTVALADGEHIHFTDAVRMLAGVATLRRIWMAVPFLAVTLFGVPSLLALIYEDIFGLSELDRGIIAAAVEPAQILGIVVALPYANRLVKRNPAGLLRFIAIAGFSIGFFITVLAFAPSVALAIAMHVMVSGTIGVLAPAVFALLSLVLPSQVRSLGFSLISVFGIPGIVVALPLIGYLSDEFGLNTAMLTMVPVTIVAGLILASAHSTIADDIAKTDDDVLSTPKETHEDGMPSILDPDVAFVEPRTFEEP